MKFSYQWICELVEDLAVGPRELEREITMRTAECEGVEPHGGLLDGACVARVLEVSEIPESQNRLAVVETERYGRKTVVCGAPNCRAGLRTVYVPLPPKTIGGVTSDGMLASGAELGINRDAAGILDLEGPLDLRPDYLIDIDNKSITHRPDLWGHVGMAREVAAIHGKRLLDPVDEGLVPGGPGVVGVEIEDFTLCPRYSALVFDNVTVKPSPLWLQYRLEAIGLNPINNIVDFTNLVMAELGQPTHAFDRAKLKGETIFVRPARPAERFAGLNDEEYELTPANLVIADAGGAVALAGVIGGRDSAIGEGTTSIVLESANFLGSNVRKTSSQLRLRTDASMRFEKSQDPANTVRALARAVALLPELSPGIRLVGGLSDASRLPQRPAPILLPLEWLNRKLGRRLAPREVRDILESLSFTVREEGEDAFRVEVPSWRATRDVSIKDDLLEEVGRMIGYDSIPPTAPLVPANVPPQNPERAFGQRVRSVMTGQGFSEAYNYSFVSEDEMAPFGLTAADHLAVANPIASDLTHMRRSLLPGILKNIRDNSRHFDAFRLFEIGREIHPRGSELPEEIPHLAAVLFARGDGAAGLFEMKRVAACLMPGSELRPAAAASYEHPARAAEILWRGGTVGRLFELHPSLAEGRAAILYVNLAELLARSVEQKRHVPPRRFPSSAFDLSVIAGARELVGDLEAKLKAHTPAHLLERIEYLRQYQGPPVPEGRKSVSFRLVVSAEDRTLSSDEVTAARQSVIDGMRAQGYELMV
ncbi:MAG: phenylalanine--tRNA ligase subunit beta [Bryobacterales bacterium]|nr:phenylalanine--tRNA ligase subunit beta [Bryobacterales bacterium]